VKRAGLLSLRGLQVQLPYIKVFNCFAQFRKPKRVTTKNKIWNYLIHLPREKLLHSPGYQTLIDSNNLNTRHILINRSYLSSAQVEIG